MTSAPLTETAPDRPPIPLHRLTKDAQGRIVRREGEGPIRFTFVWRHTAFQGVLDDSQGAVMLSLSADLGRLPFSAESRQARVNLSALLEAAEKSLGGMLRLDPGQHILLSFETMLDSDFSASTLVATIACFLVMGQPWVDMIALLMPPLGARALPPRQGFGQKR
jgi:hypothetical protein